ARGTWSYRWAGCLCRRTAGGRWLSPRMTRANSREPLEEDLHQRLGARHERANIAERDRPRPEQAVRVAAGAQRLVVGRVATDGDRGHPAAVEPGIAQRHLIVLRLGDGGDVIRRAHYLGLQPFGELVQD